MKLKKILTISLGLSILFFQPTLNAMAAENTNYVSIDDSEEIFTNDDIKDTITNDILENDEDQTDLEEVEDIATINNSENLENIEVSKDFENFGSSEKTDNFDSLYNPEDIDDFDDLDNLKDIVDLDDLDVLDDLDSPNEIDDLDNLDDLEGSSICIERQLLVEHYDENGNSINEYLTIGTKTFFSEEAMYLSDVLKKVDATGEYADAFKDHSLPEICPTDLVVIAYLDSNQEIESLDISYSEREPDNKDSEMPAESLNEEVPEISPEDSAEDIADKSLVEKEKESTEGTSESQSMNYSKPKEDAQIPETSQKPEATDISHNDKEESNCETPVDREEDN